jgi:hypothetical protein
MNLVNYDDYLGLIILIIHRFTVYVLHSFEQNRILPEIPSGSMIRTDEQGGCSCVNDSWLNSLHQLKKIL